jgi:hypothetical protein
VLCCGCGSPDGLPHGYNHLEPREHLQASKGRGRAAEEMRRAEICRGLSATPAAGRQAGGHWRAASAAPRHHTHIVQPPSDQLPIAAIVGGGLGPHVPQLSSQDFPEPQRLHSRRAGNDLCV